MPFSKLILTVVCLVIVSGCTSKQVYNNLYEGVRVRNELQTPPPERVGKTDAPSYQQYENERKEKIKPSTGLDDKK